MFVGFCNSMVWLCFRFINSKGLFVLFNSVWLWCSGNCLCSRWVMVCVLLVRCISVGVGMVRGFGVNCM